MTRSTACALAALLLLIPASGAAQDRAYHPTAQSPRGGDPGPWRADVSVGWAGFVDDATKHYLALGGSVRRYVTPRVSIGPEVVVMRNGSDVRDLNLMLTGNVTFDFVQATRDRRVVPFFVAGGGIVRMRDQVRNGPFWSSDPSFTVGGGVRARVNDVVSAGAEYRLGWEPHQRISGFTTLAW
jgi:hypothetical protein